MPPFDAAVGGLADLAVERGHRRRVDDDAALAASLSARSSAIAAAARRITLNVPIRLIWIDPREVRERLGALLRQHALRRGMPAAFTTPWMRAEARRASCDRALTSASLVTSALYEPRARPPCARRLGRARPPR